MLKRDIKEILEFKLLKFVRKYDRIEPSYQGDLDMEDLVEDTVEDFMTLIERIIAEGLD